MGERQEWLDGLVIGDEVAVENYRVGKFVYEIRRINRITPTRRISVEHCSAEFDARGRERGMKSSWDHQFKLVPVTQKIRDEIRKTYIVARLEAAKWSYLDLDVLERVLAALDMPKAIESTESPSEAAAEGRD